MRYFRLSLYLAGFLLCAGLAAGGALLYALWSYGQDLPDYNQLADYAPPTSTRVHGGDGRLLAEFAREARVFVPVRAIPRKVIQGFIAAEDKNFFHHTGVDFLALLRAVSVNIVNYWQNRRLIGASTITQQVAKNFLLSNEVSLRRKIREAILSFRIERALSKERILELYLNEIYLGMGAYGVAAAALKYFDKSLDELTVPEIAYLAALPKGPNNYHPYRRHAAAVGRRNWVIGRMLDEGYITEGQARRARRAPLGIAEHQGEEIVSADYFLAEMRRELIALFAEEGLYGGGLSVRTTLDTGLLTIARNSLHDGLVAYDRRHGWRGPVGRIRLPGDWRGALAALTPPPDNPGWEMAAVLSVADDGARIGIAVREFVGGGDTGFIPLAELQWARTHAGYDQPLGPKITSAREVLQPGDVILVADLAGTPSAAKATTGSEGEGDDPAPVWPPGTWGLRQIPEVEGALVAMDPHTGRVLAMVGGWSFARSQFNRATQALRQPGSAFKPFVYVTALENGYTPAAIILDAPFVIDQGYGLGKWKPANFSRRFFGPSPMRLGIEKSRNLMTVRLAQAMGIEKVAETAARFGLIEDMPPQLSMALGAGAVRLIDMVAAYSALVNGGKQVRPTLIDRIQDRHGDTVWRHDTRPCDGCNVDFWDAQAPPALPDTRPRLVSAASAYQIVSMLEGAVQRGTGRVIRDVGKPLAGKTGTTNDSRDSWFIGFAPDLAVGVFVGFDRPTPLGEQPSGRQETGSSVAAPIFRAFMQAALADKPPIPFRTPSGVRMIRIDAKTGAPAGPDSQSVIVEAFKDGNEPRPGSTGPWIGDGLTAAGVGTGSTVTGVGDSAASPATAAPTPADTGPSGLY